jgi:uncharacterized protein YkwD
VRRLISALALVVAPATARADSLDDAVAARCLRDERLAGAVSLALDDPQGFEASELRERAWRVGLAAPSVHAMVLRGGDAEAETATVSAWLDARVREAPRCAIGRRGDLLAIALAPRTAEVLAASATGVAMWRIVPGDVPRGASVVATAEGAEVLRASVNDDGTFTLPLDARRRWTLQLLADTEAGPTPFATWRYGDRDDDARPEGDALWSDRHVLGAINALRRRVVARALRRDPVLDAVASRHAETLARRGILAHIPSPEDTPLARLRGVGVVADRVAENLARGRTLTDAHTSLERSPSHRANLLDREVDTVGIGVARSEGAVYLVEVFAARPHLGARDE